MPANGSGPLPSAFALIGQLGVIMVVCVLAGLLAGWYLDKQLDSSPVLTVVLAIAGAGGGMVAVYRLVMRTVADDDGPSAGG